MAVKYFTIEKISKGLYKEKGSKFISIAYPVTNENQIKEIIDLVKKEYHDARHHCYAWRLGSDYKKYRYNDDGEPSSTAGKPIFGQIQSFNLTDILIIVVRYFGGTKLGVSGLIKAYKEAAADAINNNSIIEKTVKQTFRLEFNYDNTNIVMRNLKADYIDVINQEFNETCILDFDVSIDKSDEIINKLNKIQNIKINKIK